MTEILVDLMEDNAGEIALRLAGQPNGWGIPSGWTHTTLVSQLRVDAAAIGAGWIPDNPLADLTSFQHVATCDSDGFLGWVGEPGQGACRYISGRLPVAKISHIRRLLAVDYQHDPVLIGRDGDLIVVPAASVRDDDLVYATAGEVNDWDLLPFWSAGAEQSREGALAARVNSRMLEEVGR